MRLLAPILNDNKSFLFLPRLANLPRLRKFSRRCKKLYSMLDLLPLEQPPYLLSVPRTIRLLPRYHEQSQLQTLEEEEESLSNLLFHLVLRKVNQSPRLPKSKFSVLAAGPRLLRHVLPLLR